MTFPTARWRLLPLLVGDCITMPSLILEIVLLRFDSF